MEPVTLRILVAEPDDIERQGLTKELTRYGYCVTAVRTAAETIGHEGKIDVALLDFNLPDVDGVRLCENFRNDSAVVIVAFTAGKSELDNVLALQAGADHCLAKGVGVRELIACIEAVRRRTKDQNVPSMLDPVHGRAAVQSTIGGQILQIDSHTRAVTLGAGELLLTRKEFDLLALLVAEAGNNVRREVIMEKVWLDESGISTRTLDTHVHSLRRKLSSPESIFCIRQFGYRFQAT